MERWFAVEQRRDDDPKEGEGVVQKTAVREDKFRGIKEQCRALSESS